MHRWVGRCPKASEEGTRGGLAGLCLWGFERAAAWARDGRVVQVQGGPLSIVEDWSPLLHSTECFSNKNKSVASHRPSQALGRSGSAPGTACSGKGVAPRRRGHDIAVPTPISGD